MFDERTNYIVQHFAERAGLASIEASEAQKTCAEEQMRPCVLFKPAISVDGNQWCALYGDNLQDGVAGFGDSPADAMADFDRNWKANLPTATPKAHL